MGNGLAQTPLHLAVGWPEGVRLLLQHGACVDSSDQAGDTPLHYALTLGYHQTVSLLMKAGCSLVLRENVLDLAIRNLHYPIGDVSQDVRMKVLDTTIALLAERRRDLQIRLTGLPVAVSINTTVLREDRILDEYAEYAECTERAAQQIDEYIPLRASSLLEDIDLGKWRTVYHISGLVVEVAEKLWENGFRDIDVPNNDGLTPLASFRNNGGSEEIELCSWLIQKGAKLHRPQHRFYDSSPDPAIDPTEVLRTTMALHYVASRIAGEVKTPMWTEERRAHVGQLQNCLSQLSKTARLLLATIFSDDSSDDCICACSSRGCLAYTLMFKGPEKIASWFLEGHSLRDWLLLYSEYLMKFVGLESSCWDWLAKETIRLRTFQELELRHTCCFIQNEISGRIVKFEEEERAEIQDEDKEKIELLESLLLEFEEHRGTEDLTSFLKGYWATRMDEVLEELKSGVDEERLRGIGVVLEDEFLDDWKSKEYFDDDWRSENEI